MPLTCIFAAFITRFEQSIMATSIQRSSKGTVTYNSIIDRSTSEERQERTSSAWHSGVYKNTINSRKLVDVQ